jgi:transposase-like protein
MSRNETDRTPIPNPEVVPLASRRRFTAEYKPRILDEADACTGPGELSALLRREGIYSSCLSRWWRARKRGRLAQAEAIIDVQKNSRNCLG